MVPRGPMAQEWKLRLKPGVSVPRGYKVGTGPLPGPHGTSRLLIGIPQTAPRSAIRGAGIQAVPWCSHGPPQRPTGSP